MLGNLADEQIPKVYAANPTGPSEAASLWKAAWFLLGCHPAISGTLFGIQPVACFCVSGWQTFVPSEQTFQKVFSLKVAWKKSPFADGGPLCFQPPVTLWPHLGMREVILGLCYVILHHALLGGKKENQPHFCPGHICSGSLLFVSFRVCF